MNITKEEFDKMDKLDKIFYMQSLFDNEVMERRQLNFSVEEWIQKEVLAIVSELSEVLDEVNYKWWKNKKQLDVDALKEELIDVLHFFVGMCLRVGMSADELLEIYMKKNKENFDRQNGLSSKKGYVIGEDDAR